MKYRQPVIIWAGVFASLFAVRMAMAGHGASPTRTADMRLGTAVRQADFVFRGTVSDVQYRLSDAASNGDVRLPHTFVTFTIDETLKGASVQKTVTLRFMGGPDQERGKFLSVSNVPMFTAGDQDILFVSKNGQALCPLVRCAEGRFRLVGDRLYSHDGRAVFMTKNGRLSFGAPAPADDHETLHLPAATDGKAGVDGQEWLTLRTHAEDSTTEDRHDTGEPAPRAKTQAEEQSRTPLAAQAFLRLILDAAADTARASAQDIEPVRSVDFQEKFYIRTPRPVVPGGPDTPTTRRSINQPSLGTTEQDRDEEERVEQQGGNPVLK